MKKLNFRAVGDKINYALLVKELDCRYRGFRVFVAQCLCGNFFKTHSGKFSLTYKQGVMSCGCKTKEWCDSKKWIGSTKTHGKSKEKIYLVWGAMHKRCKNKNDKDYPRYGGRGITVCKEWNDFERFYEDMGLPPKSKMEIDRIDNDKGYSKDNCRWVTHKENMQNTSLTKPRLLVNGKPYAVKEIAKKLGVSKDTIAWRMKNWGTVQKGVTTTLIERA